MTARQGCYASLSTERAKLPLAVLVHKPGIHSIQGCQGPCKSCGQARHSLAWQVLSARAALWQIIKATDDKFAAMIYEHDKLHPSDFGHRWCVDLDR